MAEPVVDVSQWELLELEATGRNPHPWLRDPAADQAWLFKPVVVKNGHRQGEDWSEWLGSRVGQALGVPCADILLARRGDEEGCISRDLKPRAWQLQTGAVLLSGVVPGYLSRDVRRRGHNLDNIQTALLDVGAPPDFLLPELDGFDVLTGYLILDAVIANQDRHDENWAVLRPAGATGQDRLCGSYDHSSSLGFNLRDHERQTRLANGSVEQWVHRGRATRFEWPASSGAVTLVELAVEALGRCSSAARGHWLSAVAELSPPDMALAAAAVASMSPAAATFAVEIIDRNRRRLLDAC